MTSLFFKGTLQFKKLFCFCFPISKVGAIKGRRWNLRSISYWKNRFQSFTMMIFVVRDFLAGVHHCDCHYEAFDQFLHHFQRFLHWFLMIREVLLIEFHASLEFLRGHHHHGANLIPNVTIENKIIQLSPYSLSTTLKAQKEQFRILFINEWECT